EDGASSAGAVDLAPAYGGEERIARVLFGPYDGEAARRRLDARRRDPGEHERRRGVVAQPDVTVGAEVLLFGRPRRRVVGVRAADQPELERVHAQPLLLDEALLEGVPDVVQRRKHLMRVGDRAEELQAVQLLEAADLVGRLHAGPALGVALVLVHLDQRLHRGAERGIGGGERTVVGVHRREHQAAARVGVVRYREDVAAGQAVETLALQ